MSDDPAATSWTRGQTAAFDVPRGPVGGAPDAVPTPNRSPYGLQGDASFVDAAVTDDAQNVSVADPSQTDAAEPEERRRSRTLGVLALLALVASIVVQIIAIAVASAGDFVPGTGLAIAAIALSSVAVLVGLIAVIVGRGRILGIICVVIGVLTNPLVLVAILGYLA